MRKLVVVFVLAFACGCAGTARLRAFDEMILAGANATLRAKLERGGFFLFRPDVEGADIGFEVLHIPETQLKGEPVYRGIGHAFTDSDGVASLEVQGFFEGAHLIRSTYLANPRVQAVSQVFVVKPESPILVCDIDHTIADISSFGFLTSRPEDIPALPGSVETLRELSGRYVIVYLTARDDSFLDATVQWLRIKGFPAGPVFFSDLSKSAFLGSAEKFKTSVLAWWRKAGFNLAAGVGDKPGDARAYLAGGMKAIIISYDERNLPPGAAAVKSWSGVRDALAR
jgi:hypothetical protein